MKGVLTNLLLVQGQEKNLFLKIIYLFLKKLTYISKLDINTARYTCIFVYKILFPVYIYKFNE